jgi:hypothetical protein
MVPWLNARTVERCHIGWLRRREGLFGTCAYRDFVHLDCVDHRDFDGRIRICPAARLHDSRAWADGTLDDCPQ